MLNRKNLIETQQNMSEFLKYYDSQMEKINGLELKIQEKHELIEIINEASKPIKNSLENLPKYQSDYTEGIGDILQMMEERVRTIETELPLIQRDIDTIYVETDKMSVTEKYSQGVYMGKNMRELIENYSIQHEYYDELKDFEDNLAALPTSIGITEDLKDQLINNERFFKSLKGRGNSIVADELHEAIDDFSGYIKGINVLIQQSNINFDNPEIKRLLSEKLLNCFQNVESLDDLNVTFAQLNYEMKYIDNDIIDIQSKINSAPENTLTEREVDSMYRMVPTLSIISENLEVFKKFENIADVDNPELKAKLEKLFDQEFSGFFEKDNNGAVINSPEELIDVLNKMNEEFSKTKENFLPEPELDKESEKEVTKDNVDLEIDDL